MRAGACNHPRIRSLAALLAVAAAAIVATAPAAGQSTQRVTADPATVARDATQTVRGRNWPVFENCSRTIRASVRSAQNSAPIAQRHINDNGRFTFRWIPRNKNIGAGRWRLVVRMRCESGKDGSTFFVVAGTPIRVRP